jgi:hypothetical protein
VTRWINPLFAFAVTVAFISPFPDGAMAPRWAVLSLAPLIALRMGDAISWGSLAAIAYLAATLLWSPDRFMGVYLLWHFIVLAVIVSRETRDLESVFWAIGLGLAINTVFVMMQMEGLRPVNATEGIYAPGLFFNRNQQNCFVALAIVGLLSIRDWRAFALAIFVSLPLFTSPIQRAPVAGLVAAAMFLFIRRWPLMLPACIVLAIGLLFHLTGDNDRMASLMMRLETWAKTTENLTFFGHGIGSFYWAFPFMEYAHNDLLQVTYEFGVPGFLAALAFLCYCLSGGPIVPRLILVVFAVEGLFDFPLYQPASAFLAAIAAGHIIHARARLRVLVPDRKWVRDLRKGEPGLP